MKETVSSHHECSELLPRILRSALHEFHQSLTVFSFTASNLQFLASATSLHRATLCRELVSISEQISQAEKRYRDTLAILDWLTLDTSTLKKIALNTFLSDVLKLSGSKFRKAHCQVHFAPSQEMIHVVCSIGALTYLLFYLFFSITDIAEKSQRKNKPASWKLMISTEFHASSVHLSFSFPFSDAPLSSLKSLIAPLSASMEVQQSPKGTKLLIRLPLKPETIDI